MDCDWEDWEIFRDSAMDYCGEWYPIPNSWNARRNIILDPNWDTKPWGRLEARQCARVWGKYAKVWTTWVEVMIRPDPEAKYRRYLSFNRSWNSCYTVRMKSYRGKDRTLTKSLRAAKKLIELRIPQFRQQFLDEFYDERKCVYYQDANTSVWHPSHSMFTKRLHPSLVGTWAIIRDDESDSISAITRTHTCESSKSEPRVMPLHWPGHRSWKEKAVPLEDSTYVNFEVRMVSVKDDREIVENVDDPSNRALFLLYQHDLLDRIAKNSNQSDSFLLAVTDGELYWSVMDLGDRIIFGEAVFPMSPDKRRVQQRIENLVGEYEIE